ncbi:MAG: entericidin [Candidatus Omnitrophica bacterium]|nr:entericidin [Candidatus Omnitrophota bacterium]
MKKFSLLMLAVLFLTISVAGCNTLRGAGTDIKNTGKHIENVGK